MRGVTQRLFALFLPRLVLVEVRQTPGFANPTPSSDGAVADDGDKLDDMAVGAWDCWFAAIQLDVVRKLPTEFRSGALDEVRGPVC
jgi:hypothetical protein